MFGAGKKNRPSIHAIKSILDVDLEEATALAALRQQQANGGDRSLNARLLAHPNLICEEKDAWEIFGLHPTQPLTHQTAEDLANGDGPVTPLLLAKG